MITLFYSRKVRSRLYLTRTFLGGVLANTTIVIVPFLFLCLFGPVVHQLSYRDGRPPEDRPVDDAVTSVVPMMEDPDVWVDSSVAAAFPAMTISLPQPATVKPQAHGFISKLHRLRAKEAELLRQTLFITRSGLGFGNVDQEVQPQPAD